MYFYVFVFFFKQKTAYEMRISDWSSDVCSSDLEQRFLHLADRQLDEGGRIIGVAVSEAIGEIGTEFGHPRLDAFGGLERVGPRRQRDRHARSGMAVDADDRARAFGADLDPRDILDRSEERRVGKESGRTWRSRGAAEH